MIYDIQFIVCVLIKMAIINVPSAEMCHFSKTKMAAAVIFLEKRQAHISETAIDLNQI